MSLDTQLKLSTSAKRNSEGNALLSNRSIAQDALSKAFAFQETNPQLIDDISQELCLNSFQLGDVICENTTSTTLGASVHRERSVYLVCAGRVRLLCRRADRLHESSVAVFQAGDIFGGESCEMPVDYRAIAASDGQIARIAIATWQNWVEQTPSLEAVLQQKLTRQERLLFFKAYTEAGQTLNSAQIERLLPAIEEIHIPAGQSIELDDAVRVWLRHGEIQTSDGTLTIGATWSQTSIDGSAKTDVVLYQLQDLPKQSTPLLRQDSRSEPLSTEQRSPVAVLHPHREASGADLKRSKSRSALADLSKKSPRVRFPKPKQRFSFWHGYPFIEQQSSSDCGVACLAMISQYWGARFDFNRLRDLAQVKRSGASLKQLAIAAETIGYHARPVRASLGRLADQKLPWIAHWQGDHYVVVYRVDRTHVLVADPARGKTRLPRKAFLDSWTGYALLLDPTEKLKTAETSKPTLGQFWGLLWVYRSTLWQIIFVSLLIQLFGLVAPLFTQVILDKVVVQKSVAVLHVFAIGLVLFSVWRIGLTTVRQYLLDYFSNRLNLTLVSGFISHALMLPLSFFENRQVGDIITRVQENNKIQSFLVRQAVSTWLDCIMAVVYLGLMFYYNWQLALLVVALIPPMIILTVAATPFLRKISREIFNEAADQNSLLVELLSGVSTIKAAAAEREVRWRWEERLTRMLNVQFKGQKFANGLQAIGGIINAFGSAALLWYGAMLVIRGELTIGQFVAFNMLIGSVIAPVLSIVGLWDEFQEILISVERLNDVFSAQPEETPGRPMLVLPPIRGEVRFENMTFRYDQAEERNTLQNLSFAVAPGETIAIVGRSGSGKSTLVKLLQGLYHPTSGRIWIDGHDIRHVSPQSLRCQFGVVPQECFLFSGTIQENIQLYRPEFTLEQVVEVAKLAEAHGFIQDLPLGYSTKVGERGANLSGGQRQRIAIARALLGDPAILILDEATSSLDTESERRFQHNLMRISRGRSTFIIAHRLSTVRHVDRILVLDRGVLVEQGTHDDLIAQQGLFYHLAQQQLDL